MFSWPGRDGDAGAVWARGGVTDVRGTVDTGACAVLNCLFREEEAVL